MTSIKKLTFYTKIMSWYYSLKYRKFLVTIAVVAALALIVTLGTVVKDFFDAHSMHHIAFSEQACINFYGLTPAEAVQANPNRTNWQLDSKGRLVVTMSETERELQLRNKRAYIDQLEDMGVDFLVNCKAITVDADRFMEFGVRQGSPWGIYECAEIQMLNGYSPDEIKVKFSVKDASGEIIYQAIWPDDVIEYTYKTPNGDYTYGMNKSSAIRNTPN